MSDRRGASNARNLSEVVEAAMVAWLQLELADVTQADLAYVQRQIRDDHGDSLDYTRNARAFAQAFHVVNYRKALAALTQFSPTPTAHVADLGCGAGAATVAALVYLAQQSPTIGPVLIYLVDRSPEQLELARKLLDAVDPFLPFELKIESTAMDLLDGGDLPGPSNQIVLASHVLTENQSAVIPILRLAEKWAGPGGSVIVVERPDDLVWKQILDYCSESLAPRATGRAIIHAPNPAGNRERSWVTQWLGLTLPPHTDVAAAARRYFSAWQNQEPAQLAKVFAETALYHDKPPRPPLAGLKAIENYWREHVVPQQELSLGFKSAAYSQTSAHIEWTANFSRDGLPRSLHGTMVLDIDPGSGLITELREYYRSSTPEVAGDIERGSRSSD